MVNRYNTHRMGFCHLGSYLHVHACICRLSSASLQLGANTKQWPHFWLDWIPLCAQLLPAGNLVNGLVIQHFNCVCASFLYHRHDVVDWPCHSVILHVCPAQPCWDHLSKMGLQHLHGLGHSRFHFEHLFCSSRIWSANQWSRLGSSYSLCRLSSLCSVCFRGV